VKVECKIRRPVSRDFPQGGSDVELGRVIKFRPVDPTRSDSPHVADVTADEASALFRADARVYVPYEAPEVAPVPPPSFAVSTPTPAAPPADSALEHAIAQHVDPASAALAASATSAQAFTSAVTAAETAAPAASQQDTTSVPATITAAPASTTGQAIEGDKNGNGELSVRELRELIGKGATPEYLRELLAIEEAKGEGKRSSFCDIIMRALT